MWIRCKTLTSRLFDPAIMDKPVYFLRGKAQVSDEVGRQLAEKYGAIEVIEKKQKKAKRDKPKVGTITKADSEDIAGATGTVLGDEQITFTEDKSQEGDEK